MKKKLEKIFEKQLVKLSSKEKKFFRKLYNKTDKVFEFVKRILLGLLTFYIFSRIKDRVGYEETIYILLVVVLLFLKEIAGHLKKLLGED